MTGDLLTYVIEATVPEGDDVTVPTQGFAPFEVLDTRARVQRASAGRSTFHLEVDLLALEPGEHRLGPVRLRLVTGDGFVGGIELPAETIRVGSVLANEPNAEPKGPPPPVPVMERNPIPYIVGALLAAMLVGALAAWLIARWIRRRPKPVVPPPPPRPAWEIALERLAKLRREREAMFTEGRGVEWIDGVSDALRAYLGHRYGFDGLESTTDEVVRALRGKRLRGIAAPEIEAVLAECDLVKFAKAPVDRERGDALLDEIERIVRRTTPQATSIAVPEARPGATPA
jgi:hypothetical protein